jgi:predicted transcriptional regulator YheO
MTSSSNLILQHYIKLTEFLGKALGPDYEVALHDLTRKDRSIIAIANNYISGREVGAPLTNMALSSLRDKSYERMDYHLHYYSINVNGKDGPPIQHLFHQGQWQAHRPAVHQL